MEPPMLKLNVQDAADGMVTILGNQLDSAAIESAVVPFLLTVPSLRFLDLGSNKLDSKAVEHLVPVLTAARDTLTSLDLSFNELDGAAVAHLASGVIGERLERLRLGYNKIDTAAMALLAPCVAQCKAMKHLDLEFNPRIVSMTSLGPALCELSNIEVLHLSASLQLTAENVEDLLVALRHLAHVESEKSDVDVNLTVAFKFIANSPLPSPRPRPLTVLHTLGLGWCFAPLCSMPQVAQLLAEAVKELTALTTLDMSGNGIDHASAAHLFPAFEQLPVLETLYLSSNQLDVAAIETLMLAPMLRARQKGEEQDPQRSTCYAALRSVDLSANDPQLKEGSEAGDRIRTIFRTVAPLLEVDLCDKT